jgi:putative transposase
MDAGFCVDSLEEAIKGYGRPEIVNTDQGSQFTSDSFTGVLQKNDITISMDGRGRALDNIFVERPRRSVPPLRGLRS